MTINTYTETFWHCDENKTRLNVWSFSVFKFIILLLQGEISIATYKCECTCMHLYAPFTNFTIRYCDFFYIRGWSEKLF